MTEVHLLKHLPLRRLRTLVPGSTPQCTARHLAGELALATPRAGLTASWWSMLPLKELAQTCKAAGLALSGTKRQLAQRLVRTTAAETLPFAEARLLARRLELRGTDDWAALVCGRLQGRRFPRGLPARPAEVYAPEWISFRDWFGPGPVYLEPGFGDFWPFHRARAFARSLGLKSNQEWRAYCRGDLHERMGTRPRTLYGAPDRAYPEWVSWSDWLGTGNKGPHDYELMPFGEARELVRSLRFRNTDEFLAWCQGKRPDLPSRPEDLPTNPHRSYPDEWNGMGDWLGTGFVATRKRRHRSYAKAKRLARTLGLRTGDDWRAWARGQRQDLPECPSDLPFHPDRAYPEWEGWGEFLGTGNVAPAARVFRAFARARRFARSLQLTSQDEWRAWLRGELRDRPSRPEDIPTNPQKVYRGQGWVSIGDWLGTGTVCTRDRTFRSYATAKRLVRELGITTGAEFRQWARGDLPELPPRPLDMPSNPWRTYADDWAGWSAFLGTPKRLGDDPLPFAEAREFARSLGLTKEDEWKAWCRGERPDLPPRPPGVPACPWWAYRVSGWSGIRDWLGTSGTPWSERYASFEEAREFARSLELCSSVAWRSWVAGEQADLPPRPESIPTRPEKKFRAEWKGWRDWLGPSYGRAAPHR